ncbi:MAG: NAD(P)H-hydrate dehydratase [Candidatus Micrarchaeota archaeon]|nr:NAD(P)H-hydrate dehydratase [Candidatus Micrarchaeota archaeon]
MPELQSRKPHEIVHRPVSSRKYDYGHLLVIGGSKHYAGAPILNALGALIAGVDVVTIAAPRRVADVAVAHSPDIIAYPLEGDVLEPSHLHEVNEIIRRNVTAILIGSGMGRDKKSLDFVVELYNAHKNIPFVFDADALYCAGRIDFSAKDLLIPNVKEFGLFSASDLPNATSVKTTAFSLKSSLLVKGHTDYISDGKRVKEVKDSSAKSVYLAKGGTGDMLAGVCASLIAQGIQPFEAACIGASAMKHAGTVLGRKYGPFYLPSDVLKVLPEALVDELGK